MSEADLERRYRRFVALFPRRHREIYGPEMLAVLMAGSVSGQRFPRAAEVFDLIRAALVNHTVSRLRPSTWSAAAGVVGTIGAIGMAASHLRHTGLWFVILDMRAGGPVWGYALNVALLALWPLAAVAAIAGWRRLAAAVATLSLVAETTLALSLFGPGRVPLAVVAALLTAGGLALWAATGGAALRGIPLGATLAAGAVGVLSAWTPQQPFNVPWFPVGPSWQYETSAMAIAVPTVVIALLATAVLALPGPVRNRVIVLAFPFLGMALLHNAGLHYPPTLVALLVLMTPLAGVATVRFADRRTRRATPG